MEVVPAPDMTRTALGGHLHKMAEEAGDQILDPMDYEEVHWNEGDLLILGECHIECSLSQPH